MCNSGIKTGDKSGPISHLEMVLEGNLQCSQNLFNLQLPQKNYHVGCICDSIGHSAVECWSDFMKLLFIRLLHLLVGGQQMFGIFPEAEKSSSI